MSTISLIVLPDYPLQKIINFAHMNYQKLMLQDFQ